MHFSLKIQKSEIWLRAPPRWRGKAWVWFAGSVFSKCLNALMLEYCDVVTSCSPLRFKMETKANKKICGFAEPDFLMLLILTLFSPHRLLQTQELLLLLQQTPRLQKVKDSQCCPASSASSSPPACSRLCSKTSTAEPLTPGDPE